MNKDFEQTYHEIEESYWWFVTRRSLVRELVRRAAPDRKSAILEIGCSGGPLLQMLQSDGYDHLTGIDISPEAIQLCRRRKLENVRVMDALQPDFAPASFDVIVASDVLEHLADAPGALEAWHALLRPGGTLIVFVPAFMMLWSGHDEVNQHFYRYRAAELATLAQSCGYEVRRKGYWDFLLFLPITIIRLASRFFGRVTNKAPSGDLKPLPRPVNALLISLLRLENWLLLAGANYPWGLSAMVICQKPNAPIVNHE
jgi:SAM-dependent methyltransferase